MNIIKLNAINSTNDYLKKLNTETVAGDFTIVTAENQTAGKGQMGSQWTVEAGKNLTFSVLVKEVLNGVSNIFNLNVAVAVSIIEALDEYNIPELSIKWPNDILAGIKKIGGVLIENSVKPGGEVVSVIGIGLNVNQKNFDGLSKASSLAVAMGQDFDKEQVMLSIVTRLQYNITSHLNNDATQLWQSYHEKLFKIARPMPFESNGEQFMGIIKEVTPSGKLRVILEDDSVAEYAVKEVQLLY